MHVDLINNIIEDFKSFYIAEEYSKAIKYRIISMREPMSVRRTGHKSYIAISDNISYMEIDTDESKLFLLFMISHEIAHLINKHLNHIDRHSFDTKSLEMWADFFGAKIAMTILQRGRLFRSNLEGNFNDSNTGIPYIFKSIELLKNTVFNSSNGSSRYLSTNNRIATIIAGLAAYLTRNEMAFSKKLKAEDQAEIGSAWGIALSTKILDLKLFDTLYDSNTSGDSEDIEELTKNVFEIHNKLKGKKLQLVKGMKFEHSFILDTLYGEHKVNDKLVDGLNKKASDLGLNIKL